MLLVVPLVAITAFPQWIPHFSALACDDDDDLPWPFSFAVNPIQLALMVADGHKLFALCERESLICAKRVCARAHSNLRAITCAPYSPYTLMCALFKIARAQNFHDFF